MSYSPEKTPMTRLNIELTPTDAVQKALGKFTEDGSTGSLHVFAGVERVVEAKRLQARWDLLPAVEKIDTNLGDKAVQALFLSESIALKEREDGSARLLLKPRNLQTLANLERVFTNELADQTEILKSDKLRDFLYVDFSARTLASSVQRRREAADDFRKAATSRLERPAFHVDRPHLVRRDVQMPTHLIPWLKDRSA